ncbi:MAG: hypothetical protein ACRDXX_21005 [Stackebrandtia sp.]
MSRERADVFVVGLDKHKAAILRRLLRPVKVHDVIILSVFGLLLIALGVATAVDWQRRRPGDVFDSGVAAAIVGVIALLIAGWQERRRRRTLNAEHHFPDYAFHVTPHGMRLFVAGAVYPVWLPWETVGALEIRVRRVRWTLTVTLAADPCGATGLDQPAIQDALLHSNRRARGLWYDVDALTEPFTRIDAAIRHCSQGRLAVHNPYRRFRPEDH